MKKTSLLSILFICLNLEAAAPPAWIIGGQDSTGGDPAYAAFVASDGTVTKLMGGNLPSAQGQITSVAINASGTGIIGGFSNTGTSIGYAALVAPDGTLTQLSGPGFPSTHGAINSVAINASGIGIIGGFDNTGSQPAYAALVAKDGTLTHLTGGNLPSTNGAISGVAINASGKGIIGGTTNVGFQPAYAAFVVNGTLTQLSGPGFPSTEGWIQSVAINDSGAGIIGGFNTAGSGPAYAALVASDGTLTQVTGGNLPLTQGEINSVAINASGAGIIGGQDNSGDMPAAYAAIVAPSGALTKLTGGGFPSTAGYIYGVAINTSGTGIIGGQDATVAQPYAAFVAKDGTLTELTGLPSTFGVIQSVSIADSGVGLIGGTGYAALVAPNGTLTELSGADFPSSGFIQSVAHSAPATPSPTPSPSGSTVLSSATPQSAGPYSGVVNMQLAACYALTAHLGGQKFKGQQDSQSELALVAAANLEEVAACEPTCESLPYTLWLEPFGNYVRQDAHGAIPTTTNEVVGALLGFDYRPNDVLFGASLGYAYNFLHYGQELGHGNLQEEMASLYVAYEHPDFYLNAVVWGGIYQVHNERHSVFSLVTAKAHIHGWVLSPHIEIAFPISLPDHPWFTFQPFAMVDWVNNWQDDFREHGPSGLNLTLGDQYNSLLRSEGGLRLDQRINCKRGRVTLEEKVSYVNQTPFHVQNATTFFVASASTFPVAIGSTKIEHLAAGEVRIAYSSKSGRGKILLDLQVEANGSYQSYFAGLEYSRNF